MLHITEQIENPIVGHCNFGTRVYCSISRNGDLMYDPFRKSNGIEYSTFERMRTDYHKGEIDSGVVLQNIHIKFQSCSSIPYVSCCKCDTHVGSPYAVLHGEHYLCYKCFESFVMDLGKIGGLVTSDSVTGQLEKDKSIYLTFGSWTHYSCPAKNCTHDHISLQTDVIIYHRSYCKDVNFDTGGRTTPTFTHQNVFKNALKHGLKNKKHSPSNEEKDKWRQNRCASRRRR